jgi:FMN phosphatase YigB (HAD superfamily)
VFEFLQQASDNAVPVYVLANDVSEWSRKLRERLGLDGYMVSWWVSGDLGLRKPDRRLFRRFLTETALPPEECLFVDDRPANLRGARAEGIRVLLFRTEPGEEPWSGMHVESFAELSLLLGWKDEL